MSAIIIEDSLVHYEVIGRGKPIIFLHGWLGSWRYWMGTMEALARRHRCYALDFWGFGDSDKTRANCTMSDYLSLVDQFMDRMGLVDAPIVGHSMGGTIAIRLALEYPHRVSRLILVSAPVVGRNCTPLIKLASNARINKMFWKPSVLTTWGRPLLHRWIATNWQVWYREILEDVLKVTPEAAQQSGYTLIRTDLRPQLRHLKMPVLAMHGTKDTVVAFSELNHFKGNGLSDAHTVAFDNSQHFPMLDSPAEFHKLLLDTLTPPPD
ncbi:MAG: alpha/beta hydrolase [Chloroflexota bacterium]|nr:alpha/beta hydrolase [Chloroflexota bacterium]